MRKLSKLLMLLGLAWFAGCATSPSVTEQMAGRASLAEAEARQFEAGGQKFAALQQWLMVDALAPDHPSARLAIVSLEQELAQEADDLLQQALVARKRRRFRTARKLLLQGLAAQPHHPEIRRLLKQRESERRMIALENTESAGMGTKDAVATASAAEASVPVDASFREAEVLYQQAIDALESDKDNARLLFERVLAIEPTHLGARAYLDILR